MNRSKIYTRSLLMLVFISLTVGMASCKAFRKKNKCNSCPTWDQIDLEATEIELTQLELTHVEG